VYLVGFITRIFHDARSPERQIQQGSPDVALPPVHQSENILHVTVFFFWITNARET